MKTKIKRYSRSVLSVLLSVCILMSCMAVGIVGTSAAQTDEESVGAATYYILMSKSDNINEWTSSQKLNVSVTQNGSTFTATIPRSEIQTVTGSELATGQNYYLCISNTDQGSGCFFNDETVTSSATSAFSSNAIQSKGKLRAVRFSMATVNGFDNIVVTVTANSSTRNYALSTSATSETKYGVTVKANAGGSVVAGSTTISSGNSTTVQVGSTTATTFTAFPASGYSFGGWTNTSGVNLTSGSLSSATIKATASATGALTANFTKNTVQTRVVYYDNSQTNWTTPYARAYTGSTEYLGNTPGTAMTVFDATNNVWYINVPVDATTIVFSNNGSQACSAQTIPTDYTGPEFYNYDGTAGTGSWQKYTSPLLPNEKNATLATETANNQNLYTNINATFFDYYTDNETTGGWYTGINATSDAWVGRNTEMTNINRNPYTKLNNALSKYAADNSVAHPMYFGSFFTGSYNDPGYTNSGTASNGHKINDSNQLTKGNTSALPGLAGTTISDGNIYYHGSSDSVNGAKMPLFDKEWLAGTGSDDDANKLKLVYSSSINWPKDSANIYVIFRNSWPKEYVVKMTNDSDNSCLTATIPSGWENSKVCFVRMASGTTLTTGSINNTTTAQANWDKINGSNCWDKTDTSMTRSGNVFTLTSRTGGTWSTDYNGPLASVINSQFPVRKTTKSGINYYEFDSTGAADNVYFDNLTGNDTTLNYGAGETYGQKNGYNGGYGFFPFDKYTDQKISGENWTKSYGKDLAFGMKLDIKFTVGQGGKINNVAQKFDFSGDDDLWVYIDDKLVLDMGGDHAKAVGSIDFSTRTVSVDKQDTTLSTTRNGSFNWFDNNDTSKVHTMTLYYMERGMHESNLKFGFSFTPVSNQFVATESLSTDGINDALKDDVEAAATNDKITVTHATSKSQDGSYSAAINKDYTITGNSTKQSTGTSGAYSLGNGQAATFVGQFEDGAGEDNQSDTTQPDYFKLTTSDAAGNKFKYHTVLNSVTDLVMEQYVPQLGTDKNIFKFRSLKSPKNSLDATDIQADFVSTISTKSIVVSKSILGYNDPDKSFTVHVQVDVDGDGTTNGYKNYELKYLKDGVENTMTSSGTFTLKQNEVAIIQGIPEGAKIKISEDNVAGLSNPHYQHLSTYVLDSDGGKVTSAENGATAEFTLEDDVTAEITNKPRLQDITVTKTTDVEDYTSEFKIKIETSNDGTTWTPKTGTLYGNNHNNDPITLTDSSGFYTVKKGDTLFIRQIPEDNYVRVTESKPDSENYDFSKSAVTVDGRAASSTLSATTYIQSSTATQVQGWYQVKSANNNVTVTNRIKTKNVVLKKVVEGGNSGSTTFPIVVTYQSTDGSTVTTHTNETKNLANNETVTLSNVPINTTIAVSETAPSGYKLKSITPDGTVVTGSASPFTVNDVTGTAMITVTNTMLHKVTLKKVLSNSISGDNTDFTFNYSYTVDDTLKQGSHTLKNGETWDLPDLLPQGTVVTVTETNVSGYTKTGVSVTGITDSGNDTYTVETTDGIIQINNSRDTHSFTIKKETDVNNTADSFKIKIWTSPNGTDWTAYTSDIDSFTADANSEYTIHKDSELTVEGLMANTYIKVQETDGMTSKYTSTVTGIAGTTLETGSDNTTGIVKIGGTGQGINITNTTIKKDIIINKNVLHFENSTDAFNVNVLLNSEEAATKTYSYIGDATGTITNGTEKTGIGLKNGESITIKDVPIGTTVTVTEQAPTGRYEFVDIDTANANVTTPATTSTRSEAFVINDTANDAEVTIKNDVKTHNVVITKSINNSDNSTAAFKISATVQPLGASDTARNSWDRQVGTGTRETGSLTNMEITNGQSITIYGVPVDAKVTVTEGETANFTAVSVDGTAGSTANFIMPDTNRNVAVVNRINDKNVVVKKVVDGEASNTDTFPIKVEVKDNTSGAEFVAYTGSGFDANGKILLAANNTTGATVTVPLDAEVKVTELTSDASMPTGYTIDKITLNSGTTDVRTDNSYTYTAQADGTVTVHNKRVQGSIKVTKKISGDKYLDPDFAITVTYQRPADSEPQTHTFTVKGNGASSDLFELPYGTVVSNVSEASVAGYKLVDTDPIQYKVNDGTAQAFGSGFTVTNQPVEIIVTNELTKHTVTIQKQVVDASDAPISDSTNFTVSYENGSAAAQTGTINKGNNTVVTVNNVPYGTTFTVEEINIPRGYELKGITGNGNVTVTGNTNITVTNTKLPTYSVKVTKNVDGTADATKFGVRIQTAGTPYSYAVNGGTATTVNNGAAATVELEHNEYVTVSGLLEGEKLTVTETSDGDPNYSFEKFTVNGVDEAGTEKSYEYTVTNDNDQNIIVNNKEAAKYQYEVTYKYEGYSATTYNSDGTPKEGPHRFFKASGELSAADWTGYFGAAGNAFVTDAKAKEFFGKTAPYEDDFMMDMEFKPEKIENMNVDRTNRKVTFEVTATTDRNRTVYVYFQLPYDVNENLVATGTHYNNTTQQHEATTQYGNWVKKNGSFVSAPLTLQGTDGTHYFQYWQIRSTTSEEGRNKGKVETNYKKCFYADFNMTMYQDSYVTAVYTTDTTDYDPSTRSYQDTKDGEARINFIENSRNQWNSDGAPDLSGADKQKAGDRIYSDFLLTFGYQDLQLNTLNSTNIKTGFVVEKVAVLDTGTSGYETKTQSVYHQNDKYGSSETAAKQKVEALVEANKTSDTGVTVKDGVTSSFIMNSNINLKQLDNKNQMKYSLNMKNKEYATNGEPTDPYRNYVFRAYTYIKNGDKVVVSDPTYFTIYDMASIEPQA